MTTAAPPAPTTGTPAETFDPHAFPGPLLDAQRELDGLNAALQAHAKKLPWSREAHDGWEEVKEHWRQRAGRESTKGWESDDAAEYDRLMGELRAKAAFVHCHEWWRTVEANGVKGPALVDARQALKRAAAA
ncbi:hypothetical protein OG458_41980 (plasmid) [Streptomyces sp. NBC_01281]|uniref:hypothetical protein n=1 Tax=Streptomyces sp. NBC_01281 TaxID=2903811 RepID=UPI002E1555EB|nr:hypothetical protein OG458_41980 [Streptomyces sp. NBC_01281]